MLLEQAGPDSGLGLVSGAFVEVRLGTWFGAGFGLWVPRFLCCPIFTGRFVWCRSAVWRNLIGSRPACAPGLTLEVEEHGLFVAMEPCVAISAQQHQVVHVRRTLLRCFPGKKVVGHTFGVVGAALHAAAVTTNQSVDLGWCGEPGLAALP